MILPLSPKASERLNCSTVLNILFKINTTNKIADKNEVVLNKVMKAEMKAPKQRQRFAVDRDT